MAEGIYSDQLKPAEKHFTLAGGFQTGSRFKVRDSAKYASKAKGKGGSFIRIEDPGPNGQLTAIDGFDISGYSQAIYREFYESQRFDITNNFIHDNKCSDETLAGAGVSLVNVSGTIKGNVFAANSCGRGGAVFLNDTKNENEVAVEDNLIQANAGTEKERPWRRALSVRQHAHRHRQRVHRQQCDAVGRRALHRRVHTWQSADHGNHEPEFLPRQPRWRRRRRVLL